MEINMIERMLQNKNKLTKKQRVFCDFVIENYRTISLDSVTQIAKKANVGATTVLRAIKNLGYDGFGDFKRDLHYILMDSRIPKWWDFNDNNADSKISDKDDLIRSVWRKINLYQEISLTENLIKNIKKTVRMIINSKSVHVIGLRTSKVVALYLENSVNQFYPKINQLSYDPHFILDRIYHAKNGDVFFLITLSPFTKLTYDAARYCKELGHTIILITDDNQNSLIPIADIVLNIRRDESQYTLIPAMSLIETITMVLGKEIGDKSQESLNDVGNLLVNKNITTI